MKTMITRYKLLLLAGALFLFSSCEKFLDPKPDLSQALPSEKLQNVRLLLDDTYTMNSYHPGASDIGTDDILIPDAQFSTLSTVSPTSSNAYIWQKNLFNEADRNDWTAPYKTIFNANLALEALDELKETADKATLNSLRGSALFFRAFSFYNLLQTFAPTYNSSTAGTDLGIPLRLGTSMDEKVVRASVKQGYDQMLADLNTAKDLLPASATFKTQPARPAALALLARIHVQMKEYEKALDFAEQAIAASPGLIDYNTLTASASFPLALYNQEVLFHATTIGLTAFSNSYGRVNRDLYDLYSTSDLRRSIFFRTSGSNILYKGSYAGSSSRFCGMAVDELYLISAEANARLDHPSAAMDRLNQLLVKRYRTGSFVPFTATNGADALPVILRERRKELAFRNMRWADLKRLNLEPAFAKTLTRTVNGQHYSLSPGDIPYNLVIPEKVIVASGMQQN